MSDEKRELWEDLNGGMANYPAPNKIDVLQSATCRDVWFEKNALAKRRNIIISTAMTDASYPAIQWVGDFLYNTFIGSTEYLLSFCRPRYFDGTTANSLANSKVALSYTGSWALQKMSVAGTISTTATSTTFTGVGTSFLTTAKVGAMIVLNTDAANGVSMAVTWRTITAVNSDTDITVHATYPTTTSGRAYTICGAFTKGSRVSAVTMNNIVYYSSGGSQSSFSWNGTDQAWVSAFPSALYTLSFKNYIFAANTSANPSRISWCTLLTPSTWPALNFIDVSPNDGQDIVGIFSDNYSIVILKSRSAYRLSGDIFDPSNPTYTLTKITTPSDFQISTASSVQPWKGGFIMLGRFGMFFLSGGEIARLLQFDKILTEFTNITFSSGGLTEPRSLLVKGRYWCAVQTSSYSYNDVSDASKNAILIIDENDGVWFFIVNKSYLTTAVPRDISDLGYYSGSVYGVQITYDGSGSYARDSFMQLDTTSGSDTISASWTSKVFEFINQQRFGQVFVYFKKQSAGNLTFEYSIDEGSFSSVTIDMTTGTGTRLKSAAIVIGQVGRSIQFRMSNSTAAQLMEVYAIELNRKELRR